MSTSVKHLTEKENQVLKKGGSFSAWKRILYGVLIEKDVYECVVHNDIHFAPLKVPERADKELDESFFARMRNFKKKDFLAYSIISARLADDIRPDFGDTEKTAKELFDTIETTYKPIVTIDIYDCLKEIGTIKMANNDTLAYCERFQKWLNQYRTAAEQFASAHQRRPS